MESASKDSLIEQLQAELKQLKLVADAGIPSVNNLEDLAGTSRFYYCVSLFFCVLNYICS